MSLQFINEDAAVLLDLRCVRTRHAMYEFNEGDRRDGDLDVSEPLSYERQELFDRMPFPLSAMITLESRISPRRGDSMAGYAL
jgi:hypothetical protein